MNSSSSCYYCSSVTLLLILLGFASCCYGFGTFGFHIHHRYSDPMKGILAVDDLPEKGSFAYYSALVNRDRYIRGRGLATANDQTPLTFEYGNDTFRGLGFLHYANISLGTPGLSFIVALDTGSSLFWLPCDCSSCVRGFNSSNGKVTDFNIYSPNTSSSSSKVPCSNGLCKQQNRCRSASSTCPYQVRYLSYGTTSTGYLVEDVLHLITNDKQTKAVDSRIIFGCGQVQTGSFLEGAAPNGLFGLGMDNTSVPSILANQGLIRNSFSMCFGSHGSGRISFGDKGSSDQGETPFYLNQSRPTYNITITQISVGGNDASLEFSAIFDSGTSFTLLNDPAYTQISETFNSIAKEKRDTSNSSLSQLFEYCYVLSPNQTKIEYPVVNLTMKGGDPFVVNNPIVVVSTADLFLYCLGVVKSDNVNIIGQNFMTGYNIIFDREKNVLGWKPSNCSGVENSSALPTDPPKSSFPPATAFNPEATTGSNAKAPLSAPPPMGSHSLRLHPFTFALFMMILVPFFAII